MGVVENSDHNETFDTHLIGSKAHVGIKIASLTPTKLKRS
jgi:hypothetical protein